jgi:YbgC/YbaW family acyl-CoA thioester hydrolase
MSFEIKVRRRVEFSETDMAGIVHFSNFFRYMETAEHEFYRSLGFSVVLNQFDPPLGFPRVHAACDYKKPLRFGDTVEIHLQVKEKRSRVLSYQFRFTQIAAESGPVTPLLVATGELTVVCVAHAPGRPLEAIAIPPQLAEKISVTPNSVQQ